MTMQTDRQRIEASLPAALLYRVFSRCIAADEDHPDKTEKEYDKQVLEWLGKAAFESFDGLAPDQKLKLMRRGERVLVQVLTVYENRPVMTVFLIVLFWLQDLLAREVLVMIEGSTFDRAVSALLPELGKHTELWESVQKSAGKNAIRFRESFERLGYYRT